MRARPAIPNDLALEEKVKLKRWALENAPELSSKAHLRYIVDETLDWHRMEGRVRKDWLATVRNRIRALHAQGRDPLQRMYGGPENDEEQRAMAAATRRSQMHVVRTAQERAKAQEPQR